MCANLSNPAALDCYTIENQRFYKSNEACVEGIALFLSTPEFELLYKNIGEESVYRPVQYKCIEWLPETI
jgi:hypothetical protein